MIAIPIIATGTYIRFVPELIKGINKFFLPNHQKKIFVFTDFKGDIKDAEKVYQEQKPWPFPTLYRYHIIYNHLKDKSFDYVYYIDADFLIVDYVGDEILGRLVAVRHPGFFNKSKDRFELSGKFLSKGYINPNEIEYYYAGGFNGGSEYLTMAKTIIEWTDIDQKYGFTQPHHDENYLNRHCVLHKPDVILSPEYCMPQTMRERKAYGIDYMKPKMIAITK
jgi:histo-blood group ABO system transferase